MTEAILLFTFILMYTIYKEWWDCPSNHFLLFVLKKLLWGVLYYSYYQLLFLLPIYAVLKIKEIVEIECLTHPWKINLSKLFLITMLTIKKKYFYITMQQHIFQIWRVGLESIVMKLVRLWRRNAPIFFRLLLERWFYWRFFAVGPFRDSKPNEHWAEVIYDD